MVQQMEDLLSPIRLNLMSENKWLWIEGEFSFLVALAYREFTFEVSDSLTLVNFCFRSFWKCDVPSNAFGFFLEDNL